MLSGKGGAVTASATMELSTELARLRAAGEDVAGLLEGEPDLPVPESVALATKRALDAGLTRYSSSSGLPKLKQMIADKLSRENGIEATEANVLIANGSKQILFEALQTLCGPGDEVIVPRPYWTTTPVAVRLSGATPVFVDFPEYQLSVPLIEKALTRNTRAVVLNTPNNPTGVVYHESELRRLALLAVERDFFILSDEAYEHLVYDGRKHTSIASFGGEAAKRTITIQTFSKSYSMGGFRVGYLAAEPEIVAAVGRLHGHVTGNVCTFAQHGAMAALALDSSFLESRRAIYQSRRDLAFGLARKLFDCVEPQGAFYLFGNASRYLSRKYPNSAALAAHLLSDAKVALVPGSAYGLEGYLRISFSASEDQIKKGFARIGEALK